MLKTAVFQTYSIHTPIVIDRWAMQHSSDNDKPFAAGELSAHQAALEERIREKIADYGHYNFTMRQTMALNIFFDLAQEYEDLAYLYHLPVELLRFFFDVKAALYALNADGEFALQTSGTGQEPILPSLEALALGPCSSGAWSFFPVKGRPAEAFSGKRGPDQVPAPRTEERELLAVIAILPDAPLTGHEKLFYEKFANRLGFSLHNRILALKNLEHIDFVRSLVHDIGHNVIVPNLHFKLLMRQMEDQIRALKELAADSAMPGEKMRHALAELGARIEEQYEEIDKQFHQSSFFLETLLRQSHFDQGRYVLQRARFSLSERVVSPQLERYRTQFRERGITVEEEIFEGAGHVLVNGDLGLLSQVVANFFSNAVKYARPMPEGAGLKVRCTTTLEKNYFGEGQDGVKVAVLTTGAEIAEEEASHLFTDSFRASNTGGERGTGHGLFFSRLIMGQHGGECGYTHERDGNVFYLVLPVFTG